MVIDYSQILQDDHQFFILYKMIENKKKYRNNPNNQGISGWNTHNNNTRSSADTFRDQYNSLNSQQFAIGSCTHSSLINAYVNKHVYNSQNISIGDIDGEQIQDLLRKKKNKNKRFVYPQIQKNSKEKKQQNYYQESQFQIIQNSNKINQSLFKNDQSKNYKKKLPFNSQNNREKALTQKNTNKIKAEIRVLNLFSKLHKQIGYHRTHSRNHSHHKQHIMQNNQNCNTTKHRKKLSQKLYKSNSPGFYTFINKKGSIYKKLNNKDKKNLQKCLQCKCEIKDIPNKKQLIDQNKHHFSKYNNFNQQIIFSYCQECSIKILSMKSKHVVERKRQFSQYVKRKISYNYEKNEENLCDYSVKKYSYKNNLLEASSQFIIQNKDQKIMNIVNKQKENFDKGVYEAGNPFKQILKFAKDKCIITKKIKTINRLTNVNKGKFIKNKNQSKKMRQNQKQNNINIISA